MKLQSSKRISTAERLCILSQSTTWLFRHCFVQFKPGTKQKVIRRAIGIIKPWDTDKWCWWTYKKDKDGNTYSSTTSVNPFPRWWFRIKWNLTLLWLTISGQKYKQCQGCGEGIAKWRIDDPNHKPNSGHRYNCCDGCVNFYDWHWSKRPINISTKSKKRG